MPSNQGQQLSQSKQAVRRRKERALLRKLKAECVPATTIPKKQPKKGKKGKSLGGQERIERGSDVIGMVTVDPSDKIGMSLLRFVVNPVNLPGTRLAQFSSLWQRWAPRSLRVEVTSAAGMMIPGSYIVNWAADPQESLLAADPANIAKLTAFGGAMTSSIGKGGSKVIPCKMSRTWYAFKGADTFDECHGVVLAALSGPIGSTSVGLTFTLHWTIAFSGPDVASPRDELLIQPEEGYSDPFTDSVSDWASGAKLTFKHAVGGSVVPWPGIRANVVYEPAKGVKVKYYDNTGAEKEAKFFSKMRDSSLYNAALVCHATEANAITYQQTGSLTVVLSYNKAGPVVEGGPYPVFLGRPIITSKLTRDSQSAVTAQHPIEPQPSTSADPTDALLDKLVDRLLERLEQRLSLLGPALPRTQSTSTLQSGSVEVLEKEEIEETKDPGN